MLRILTVRWCEGSPTSFTMTMTLYNTYNVNILCLVLTFILYVSLCLLIHVSSDVDEYVFGDGDGWWMMVVSVGVKVGGARGEWWWWWWRGDVTWATDSVTGVTWYVGGDGRVYERAGWVMVVGVAWRWQAGDPLNKLPVNGVPAVRHYCAEKEEGRRLRRTLPPFALARGGRHATIQGADDCRMDIQDPSNRMQILIFAMHLCRWFA